MENQDFNKELLDYIYGEMSATEKKAFAQKLKEDSKLKSEYDELTSVREELGKLEDKEVMEPFSTWGRNKISFWNRRGKRRLVVFRPITAVAASLLILMVVGYLTQFTISLNKNGFQMGYGSFVSSTKEKVFTENEVKSMLKSEIEKNNTIILARIGSSEQSNNSRFATLETSMVAAEKLNNQKYMTNEDVERFFVNAEGKHKESFQKYLATTSAYQQDYFKTMLTQFGEFMQEQRSEDLNMIRSSFVEIKQSQNLQKKETEQVIASLFTTVKQQK